jgi:hypothetical protein
VIVVPGIFILGCDQRIWKVQYGAMKSC